MDSVKVVQRLRVSPPPGSVPTTDLALTYFDVRWLTSPPNQRLLFYRYNGTADDFRVSHFSALRRSLSRALAVFFPVAGRLVTFTENGSEDHVIRYSDGDSVPLYLAESRADFDRLIGNHLKDVKDLHPFAPALVPFETEEIEQTEENEPEKPPFLAVQVTVFPFSGVCVGITLHHVVADGSSATAFLKSWASISRTGGDISAVEYRPLFDRAVVGDLEELKRNLMNDMKKIRQGTNSDRWTPKQPQHSRVLRGTFVLTRSHIDLLRERLTPSGYDVGPKPSTYTIATAYAWVCAIKAREVREGASVHFAFAVDCRSRLDPPVPPAYFGNCVKGTFVEAGGNELTRETGFSAAAEAIHRAIRSLDEGGGVMKDAKDWIWNGVRVADKRVLTVASSPRFKVYEADFGWGRPVKVDLLSIEKSGAISLAESRDGECGVEIGFVGPDYEMERFASIFEGGLRNLFN